MGRMKYGYARVSTDDRNPALQLAVLKKAGCQTAFKDEGLSGATTKRPAPLLEKAGTCRDARLCGSSTGWAAASATCITMLDDLRARGVRFHPLTEAIDTATPTGRAR
jgi:DNA invertase Pin-like site-specific DNA recombinase